MDTEPRPRSAPPRERLLDVAYDLFSRRGVRDVGIDELVALSGVAKATLYKHFASKDDLVAAFLDCRAQRWTAGRVEVEVLRRAETPEGRMLAIFDVFDDWFREPGYEACSFVNVLLEMGADHPLGRASIRHLADIRAIVRRFATEARLVDADSVAHSWHLLMKGSIVAAAEGDQQAAQRAKAMARSLLAEHRPER